MKTLFLILVLFSLLTPALAFAVHETPQGLVTCGNDRDHSGVLEKNEACTLCNLFQLVNNLVNWMLLVIIPVIAPIFLVIGGIYLLIARGDPAMFKKGKDVLTATIIGLIIIYTAWVLLSTVLTFLGVADWTGLGSWWEIQCMTLYSFLPL
jgi:hypothetical protein